MPPMPIVKGETEELYSTIAEICKVDDLTDTSDESPPESAVKENSNKGPSVRQDSKKKREDGSTPATVADDTDAPATVVDGTDASATVADSTHAAKDITEKTTTPNSGVEISTAAPSKSDTPTPDSRREKDKLDFRRDKERRRRGAKIVLPLLEKGEKKLSCKGKGDMHMTSRVNLITMAARNI